MSTKVFAAIVAVLTAQLMLVVGCVAQQSDDQALQSLREMNRSGRTPSESVIAGIESRFSGSRTGVLARLLRAKVRYDNKDFAGAAALVTGDEFRTKTTVGDHALYLRGIALVGAADYTNAMESLKKLVDDFPDSIRVRAARLAFADAALAAGKLSGVPSMLSPLAEIDDADALIRLARFAEAQGRASDAVAFYRRAYFYGPTTIAAGQAESRLLTAGETLTPQNIDEATARADKLFDAKAFASAEAAYNDLINGFPKAAVPAVQLKRLTIYANLRKAAEAQSVFNAIPAAAAEKQAAYYQLVLAYARARQWQAARGTAGEMRAKFPSSALTAKAWVDAGMTARDAKNKGEEQYFLQTAVTTFPNAVEVAGAQFELAWLEHEAGNFVRSSQMLIEHLARYAERDTTNRGKAGYWAARDSERAGKIVEACALYDGVLYRYSANWYGYLAEQRLANLKRQNKCNSAGTDSLVRSAVRAMRTVTVASETSTTHDRQHAERGDELASVGIFDWAVDELTEARGSAPNSPKINLALARAYRYKGDNVNAFLALAKSYPDYSQMFPEEMSRDEWEIFYPLTNWGDIKTWSARRNLDRYQVAGFIRQESVFDPRARSGANAYGLMQLLLPTARAVARKYGSASVINSPEALYYPPTNIELGTAYIRDQFDKFGRIEYVAVAYNAGPNRVPAWRASLPLEIDDFVEAIPFRETKAYVQGVIRNSAQYRRLYDDNGSFKSNVGAGALRGEIDTRSVDELRRTFPDLRLSGSAPE